MTDLKELRARRGAVKAKLTRFRDYLDANVIGKDNLSDDIISSQLQVRLEKAEPLFDEFNEIQTEIELLDDSEIGDTEREVFENKYFELIGVVKSTLKAREVSKVSSSIVDNLENMSIHSNANLNGNVHSLVKLPPITIPTFDGDYNKWLEFKDIFVAMVHENEVLTNIQKFYYLRASLVGEAAQSVHSLQVSGDNYGVAWQTLSERFENKGMIVYSHIHDIFEHPKIVKESHVELRHLFDSFTKHLRALKALGENTDSWDRLIIYILCNKFDTVTRRDWEGFKIAGELPTINDINKFLKQKCEVLEKLEVCKTSNKNVQEIANKRTRGYGFSATNKVKESDGIKCYYCKNEHSIFYCKSFLELSIPNRIAQVKRLRLCTICLRDNHPFWKCKLRKCFKCHKSHNTILHLEEKSNSNQLQDATDSSQESSHDSQASATSATTALAIGKLDVKETQCEVARLSGPSQVLLSTAEVVLQNAGKQIKVRALLDSGSQSNFLSERVCKFLGLQKSKIEHVVKGIGQTVSNINSQIKVTLRSCSSEFKEELTCLVMANLVCKLPTIGFNKEMIKLPYGIKLADPNFNEVGDIDLLLGSDIFWRILVPGFEQLGTNLPILKNTLLGWVIAGKVGMPLDKTDCQNTSCHLIVDTNNLAKLTDKVVMRFWELEEVNVKKSLSENERFCERLFRETVRRNDTGRFIVTIPFKSSLKDLGNSRDIARRRFELLERRLSREPELRQEYNKFLQEYHDLNHMSEIDAENSEGYFLPHHAVVKTTSLTTRCRVVFDSSCKTDSGLSLNDVQYVGPKLQQEIFPILARFRTHSYVMTADISKMYRQILIEPDQRKYQKIFWRASENEELRVFSLNTVTYGNASSPYLAVRCLFQLAEEMDTRLPNVSKILRRDFYMDDLLTGSNDQEELLNLQRHLTVNLNSAGFPLRKWLCSNSELLKKFELNDNLDVSIVHIGEGEQNKTLGIYWDSNNDLICYKVNINMGIPLKSLTKRTILSVICQIFDPLGLLGPVLTSAKLMVQELWKQGVTWDQALPEETLRRWNEFQRSLELINDQIKIPRHALVTGYVNLELHGFCDASIKAYGACVYLRCQLPNGRYVIHLLCAKSRVAPIKQVSLPRLELCGAVLLSNLVKKVTESLELEISKHYYWTDSTIVLAWIESDSTRWKTFVANRVSEIQTISNVENWGHVSSADNPADLLSRGSCVVDLIDNILWWNGPEWLNQDCREWRTLGKTVPVTVEEKRNIVSCVITLEDNNLLVKHLLQSFSSLKKMCRILSLVLRFIKNVRNKSKGSRIIGTILPSELEGALTILIISVQKECFPDEYLALLNKKPVHKKSKLLPLNPILHNNLIRVGGRLKHSNEVFDRKYPIILPSSHLLTDLIIIEEHKRLLHCGVQTLLCSIRQKYWPISGRSVCKKIQKRCVNCFKSNPRPMTYLMGDLPASRVSASCPFSNVGTDYGGPFFIKDRKTRGAKISRAYICLFVCMSVKAVHIELVSELTTEAFMAAFKRFVSRRGLPRHVYSDNGTNYVGANNDIRKVYEFLQTNCDTIADQLGQEQVQWHFIPARSPNFGGLWEAGIKSAKTHIKRVIGVRSLTFEEFATVLTQIEGVINSRPLCAMTADPEDLSALTPGHFLIGRPLTSLPERDLLSISENRLKKWQSLQLICQHYWARWHKEYLSELQTRVKWRQRFPELLKVGALVLIKEDHLPCCSWPLGRITELIRGSDNVIRVVKLKVRNNEITRAVNKVCVFPNED